MQQEFKFSVSQKVSTPFDDQGIVTVCAVDKGGVHYYVKTKAGGNWFREGELT